MPVESGSPFLFFETFFCFLSIILKIYIIFVQIFNTITMKTKEIIQMIKEEESKLWVALKNSELVFGREHEATKMARARWSTTLEILSLIINKSK